MTDETETNYPWASILAFGELIKIVVSAVFGGCLTLCFLGPIALALGGSAAYWLLRLFGIL